MPALALTVDQSLVDRYLERVDRFVDNVKRLGDTLANMGEQFKSARLEKEEPVYQEASAAAVAEKPVVTADDIDLDALLQGIDLGEAGVSM